MSLDGVLRILLASFALVGHVLLWIEFINHSHATRMPRWGVWALTLFGFGALGFGPLAFIVLWWLGAHEAAWRALYPALQYYAILCIVSAGVLGPLAVFHRRRKRLRNAEQLSSVSYEFGKPLGLRIDGRRVERWLNYLPGNEVFHLEVTHKRLTIDGLPPELDGLRLCHLTDLHYTGRIPRRFFDEVVEQANALAPDLTLLTGDIVDKSPCIDWLAPTLGKLRAEYGCYYILGNHDKRVPIDRLRAEIERCGLKSVSHRTLTLDVRGATILLAGNELPWLPPAANMKQGALLPGERPHLRLLLSHSPDQFAWARAYAFDLMLAGHNHGGQITFPWIGPVFVPSRYGVKYASGLFFEAPTLLHVSRGVSSELPARLRCPPEVALLELRRGPVETTSPIATPVPPRDR